MNTFARATRIAALAGLACLCSCASASREFVEQKTGYAVIRGRILQVENLSAGAIRRFADGMAVTVSKPGCKVQIAFDKMPSKLMDVDAGVILVYGQETDFVLQAAPGVPAR